jgi:FO synthase
MNESISRAAGTEHGQEFAPEAMERFIRAMGRVPRQRTTLYEDRPPEQVQRSFHAAPLAPIVLTPPKRKSTAPARTAAAAAS